MTSAPLQRAYGANFNFNADDSVYSWNPNTGEMSINGAPMGAPGDGSAAGQPRLHDDLGRWRQRHLQSIELHERERRSTSDRENGARPAPSSSRTSATDTMPAAISPTRCSTTAIPASLIENAITGPGNDVLVANQAANHLTGGGGSDIFRWMTIDDAGVGALSDTVTDFQPGLDKIDFSLLDAIPTTAPRDAFTFIGTNAFHNVVGEVRYDVIGGDAHIFADADGNGIADMEIIVSANPILTASDFNF
jgi:hypothetical protein